MPMVTLQASAHNDVFAVAMSAAEGFAASALVPGRTCWWVCRVNDVVGSG